MLHISGDGHLVLLTVKLQVFSALIKILQKCFRESNLVFFSANGLNCHVCSSDKFKDCATLHSFNLPTELCPPEFTSCFTKIEGKQLRMLCRYHIFGISLRDLLFSN